MIEDARWVGTPAVRVEVVRVLVRELMVRVMLHDLRGSLTAVRGWVELLGMDGRQVPGGLTRSVDGFDAVVRRYSELPFGGRPPEGQPGLLGLVSRTLAVSTGGLDGPGPVSAMRLVAALELVRPSRVSLLAESVDGEALQVIRVEGLSPEGVTMALTPHHDLLMARLEAPDALLGACLLREVARGGRGEVRSRSPGTLDLVCRV